MHGGAILWLFGALAVAATCYYLAVVAACLKFRSRTPAPLGDPPPVSILKPARGPDPGFEQNLRAHREQDYPELEVLVGVAGPADAAAWAAQRLGVQVVVCGEPAGGNRKVAALAALASQARHDLLVVDDADIRPPPGWLAETVAALEQPGVGLATCLYRAHPGATLGSMIDAVWLTTDFAGQALTGAELAGMPFALGATMALRREDLDRIGGFAALEQYLADDYQLGVRVAALGKRTVLAPAVVETIQGETRLGEAWRRHLRWSRTIRLSRPGGHLGFVVTFGLVWSAALLLAGGPLALAGACLAARALAAGTVARTVRARLGAAWLLLPAVDLWAFSVWFASFFSNTVQWRGRTLALDRHGRILSAD